MTDRVYTIGFANLSETNPFAVQVRQHLEAEVARQPDLALMVRDNAFNTKQALANVDEFIAAGVDLAILYHIDERAGNNLVFPLRSKRIPVIAIDIPLSIATFFGTDVKAAGLCAGEALGQWIKTNWRGQIDRILVVTDQRILDVVKQRFDSALIALDQLVEFDNGQVMYLDGGSERPTTKRYVSRIIENWSAHRRIAILCINDDTAAGVLTAVRALDRERDVAVLSFDGTDIALEEFRRPDSRLIVSPLFPARDYGTELVKLARQMLAGEQVSRSTYVQPVCLTRDNFEEYA